MKRFLFILLFLCPVLGISQTIHGTITDESGRAISNVFLIAKISGEHWHSNEVGEFTINMNSDKDTLIITHLGYEEIQYPIIKSSQEKKIQIILKRKSIELNQVTITGKLKSLNIITDIDLHTNPVNSSQEILQTVPGLIIGQHAGGGKAEQMFLRGFDIDHGTDINITVDGMPVNMVSHAHGQGYADLHFLIPEIIGGIDFGKGPYYTEKGNFNTAGYVEFITKDKIDKSSVGLSYGSFNNLRLVSVLKLIENDKERAYFAGEYLLTDGPFESSQNMNRINLFAKFCKQLNQYDKLEISASHFSSKWDASGQVPQRAIDSGLIGRFGAIDDTEGGFTGRNNLNLEYFNYLGSNTFVKSKAFYSNYDFELYSNFTFFLNDPVNGDQIRQKENRTIYGASTEIDHHIDKNALEIDIIAGIGLLYNDINDIELSHTVNRKTTIDQIQLGDIDENNMFTYFNFNLEINKWLINAGVRFDYFKFNYVDKLSDSYTCQSFDKPVFSPKFNIMYNSSSDFQLFLKSGIGYHSNDARVILAETENKEIPKAYGSDFGFIWKPTNRIIVNTSLWYLFLEQEFVYVGDEGVVEPSGRTQREGVDFGVRLQLNNYIFLNNDVNYTFAKSMDEPEGMNYIPLAPDLTNTGGISLQNFHGFSGGIRYRYIKNRPANEDNSIIAKGYLIADANINYTFKNFEISFTVENMFNTEWNETQFATESRLFNEPESVEEIHFIPGSPLFIKGGITYRF